MIYITGDTHRDFTRIEDFCARFDTAAEDVLIILGDAGINYFGDGKDKSLKQKLLTLPITLFCIHGNHEMRPATVATYEETEWHGGAVYIEREFPNLLFAKDGEIFKLEGKRCVVIGGAYSVDKHYRQIKGWNWFGDEQPSEKIKAYVERRLAAENWNADIVLSHTSPLRYEPRETFIQGVDQRKIDKSTELWLDEIAEKLTYEKWFCGHYHINKVIDKQRFLFEDIIEFR
ncbi:MAG: metallophosphoesterase [Oscillospiraceae bacterium]|jgi:3-oxoacid CoA-transferase subunit A|nr:metallophosphoesterase [Oscillospiraceae bacterium]